MSYSAQTLALAGYELLRARGAEAPPSLIPRLAASIPLALRKLAESVGSSDRPERRQLLVTEYAATVTSATPFNYIDLTTLTDSAGSPMRESLGRAEIYSAGSPYRWQPKGSRSVLSLQRTDGDFIYYTVSDAEIHTTSSDASATVRTLRVPTLSSVPEELNDELVEILAGLSLGEEAKPS